MPIPYNQILKQAVEDYLEGIDINNPPSPAVIEEELIQRTNLMIDGDNAIRDKTEKLKKLKQLDPQQIADVIVALHPIRRIAYAGTSCNQDYDTLGIYQYDGPDAGTYITSQIKLETLIKSYNYTMKQKDIDETLNDIRRVATRCERSTDPDLIAVNNGIFNYRTKQLMPFDQDIVFTAKSHVNYMPNATNPVIHNNEDNTDWDVESWMTELSDDPEIVKLLWEIMGAVIRPNVSWNKSAWFYSDVGNNGKGTFCVLLRELVGEAACASIKLSEFGQDFMLEPLISAAAIITDENDVGAYIDQCASLKAIITGDKIQINRKYKTPIAFQFKGLMVQCLNELPRMKDRSPSMARRQLFVPFMKCFNGVERKYIKNDYLRRNDVLEYVLCKILNTDYYELSNPKACTAALETYREYNDPVVQFVSEILPLCQWDLLPAKFLHDLYCKWYAQNVAPSGWLGQAAFNLQLQSVVKQIPGWMCSLDTTVWSNGKMDVPEPLIEEYDLERWYGNRTSQDPAKKLVPLKKAAVYRGIVRLPQATMTATANINKESEN